MLLFSGLGNPRGKFARNRHNAGRMAVEAIAARYRFGPPRQRFRGVARDGLIAGRKIVCLQPETFMNLSGQSVGEAMRFFKLNPADVIVFHDELDLAPGKMRVKTGGGHGGHNGLRSIDAHIGPDYRRVRIGIGHPGAREDEEWLIPLLDAIAQETEYLIQGQDAEFQSRVAMKMNSAVQGESRPGVR